MKQKLTCSFVIPNTAEGHQFVALMRKYRNPEMKVKINLRGRGPRPKESNRFRSRYNGHVPIAMSNKLCIYTSIDRAADYMTHKVKRLEEEIATLTPLKNSTDAVSALQRIEAMVAKLDAENAAYMQENRRIKNHLRQALEGV